MNDELARRRSQLLQWLEDSGILISEQKDIRYGWQVEIRRFSEKLKICLYYGKKGFRFVLQGASGDLKEELETELPLLFQLSSGTSSNQTIALPYVGSDESGKGDYFGPLTCAIVRVTRDNEARIKAIGVQDSKQLSEAKILQMAEQLRKLGPADCRALVLKPAKYNELYQKFQSQRKNLNHLLAWMHQTLIRDLAELDDSFQLAVVDQFSKADYITPSLKKYAQIRVHQETKAESTYMAVAAASIVARAELIRWHRDMQDSGLQLPYGAGPAITRKARELVGQKGAAELQNLAKLHFKTTHEVLGRS